MHNRQFYTYKFKSSRLKEFNYNININFNEGKELKEVIALADSQILRSIRDIRKHVIKPNKLEKLYMERDIRKQRNHSIENSIRIEQIQAKINRTMFMPDYITVVMEDNIHYEKIFKDGILINNKTFRRLSCSAGQARESTVALCNEEIITELIKRLNNGRDINKKITPSKFNSYFGLAGSATYKVSDPKFIVVKDFKNKNTFKANYITETSWDLDDEINIKDVTLEMNRTDGMGLISPKQAKKWSEELGLDWIVSQFCIRQNFLKGMLCVFDIHKFCEKENNGTYIVDTIYKDENGNYIKADLRDYDVIITESQFKLWDSFPNIETYIKNCHENKLYWGISQYTPKEAKDILKLNYQFIQTLDIKEENIQKLSKQFVDWICGVSYDDQYYMLLFLLGVNNNEYNISKFIKNSSNYWIKSLIVNPNLKNDKYIRTKIRELIKTKIKNACMGNIFVDGNFQVLVYDPYAFMQHICNIEVTGLLKQGEFYSNYWNERNIKQVDAMRSPLTYRSEHVILNFKKNDLTEKWYQHCKFGIIVNYHGHEMVNFGGADVDFDILATSSNSEIISGVYKDELPVVYNPPTPEKIIFTDEDLYKADTFSFGSIIGSITNKSSNAYALLLNIEKYYGKESEEYQMILSRLKQCCKAQSAQIDKAKIGKEVKGIPKIWVKKQEIKTDKEKNILDSEDIIKEKNFYNSILLNRYPYFFKYLYKDAKKRYNKYCEQTEITCHQKFKKSFKKLIDTNNKNIEEQKFIDNFYNYSPLTHSDSSMNLLCKYIESINFDINTKIKVDSNINIIDLYKNKNYFYTQEQYEQIIKVLQNHIMGIQFDKFMPDKDNDMNFNENTIKEFKLDNDNLERKINKICSNIYIVVNCLIDYFYKNNLNTNKDILWNTYGKYIFYNVKTNTNKPYLFPFLDENGDIVYLNKKYSLKGIEI